MFQPLSTLLIAKEKIKKFNEEGYIFVEDIKNIPNNDINKFFNIDVIKKVLKSQITLSALDYWQAELQYERITTLSEALNNVLGGGIQCGIITEICGPPGSGKTQLCFQIAITVQISPDFGGLASRCLYIDTKNTFSTQRIEDLIIGFQETHPHLNLNRENITDNIIVASIGTCEELLLLIKKLGKYIKSSSNLLPIRLILIDSLAFLTTLMDTSQKISYYSTILDELQKLASKYNIAIVIVNELATQVDNNDEIYFESSGGQVVASRCNTALMLARINNTRFAARLLKSSTKPKVAVLFSITTEGIQDGIIKK